MPARIRENPGIFVSFACLVIFAVAWTTAWGFPARARIFPLYMVAAGFLVVLFQIVIEFWKPLPADQRASGADLAADDDYTLGQAARLAGREYAWVLGLFLAVYLIGPIISLPAYVAAYARGAGKVRWLTAVLMALALFAIMMLVFERMLRLSWPRGVVAHPQRWLLGFLRDLGL